MIEDRLTRGFLAGLIGGIVMAAIDLILTAFNQVKFPYYDWGMALIRGSTTETLYEAIVGQLTHILFAGLLGVLFIYIVLLVTSRNIILKGWLYGFTVWFSVHVAVNLYSFQPLRPIPTSQMVSDFFTGSIYGIVLAVALRRLTSEKIKQ